MGINLRWASSSNGMKNVPALGWGGGANLRQESVFGLTGSAWQNTDSWYVPGTGNPAISTDDWYHSNGVYGMRPYDLTAAEFGAAGASIAASRGRYAWIFTPDHGAANGTIWNGSYDFRIGYSNDPGIFPDRMTYLYSPTISTTNPVVADFTGSISGTTLTVSGVNGVITNDGRCTVAGSGVTVGTQIVNQISTSIPGVWGKDGTYTVSVSQTVASTAMTANWISNAGIYQEPQLVGNPDDATYPFYLYGEMGGTGGIQHATGVIRSADLLTWTAPLATHAPLHFNAWASFQRVKRIGTGNWKSEGYQVGFPQNGNQWARAPWTSTDGLRWNPATSSSQNLVSCLPTSAQVGTSAHSFGLGVLDVAMMASSPHEITIGGQTWVMAVLSTENNNVREGSQYVGRVPVDSNGNVLDSPGHVLVSAAYDGIYPGPNYLQGVTGHEEDGILHYFAIKGWPISNTQWGTAYKKTYANGGIRDVLPVVEGTRGLFKFAGLIKNSGTVLEVTSVSVNSIVPGANIYSGLLGTGNNTIVGSQINGTPGGAGDYNITMQSPQNIASGNLLGACSGGLWHQTVDYYSEVVDATAAASAAPVGFRGSASAGIALFNWFDALPHKNYRLYRGTNATTQATLIGDVTGLTTTDAPGGTGIYYYKLVTMNGGEQKFRVIPVYVSSSNARVNAHMLRALLGGADPTTINRSWIDTFDAWLVSEGLVNNLLLATSVEFGVVKDGSNVISKIFDYGTTRLPRGGDYTTSTSNTAYSTTGINSLPAWVNSSAAAQGYYGGDRAYVNNIRRKKQITLFAAYQKGHTNQIMPFVTGQFGGRMYLSHDSGSPGTVSFAICDATQQKIATGAVSGSATSFHTMAGVFDGTNAIVYSDGVAVDSESGLVIPSPNLNPPDSLTGDIGSGNSTGILVSGGDGGLVSTTTGAITYQGNRSQYAGGLQLVLDVGLSPAQNASLNSLIRTQYGL